MFCFFLLCLVQASMTVVLWQNFKSCRAKGVAFRSGKANDFKRSCFSVSATVNYLIVRPRLTHIEFEVLDVSKSAEPGLYVS